MKNKLLALAVALFVVACKEDGAPFLPLSELCIERARVVCSAIERCCDLPYEGRCVDDEVAACDAERTQVQNERGRSYDSEQASARLSSQRDQAEGCGELFALASFFAGGASDGAACALDAECASGLCIDEACGPSDQAIGSICPTPAP